jgi:hypothetical protein
VASKTINTILNLKDNFSKTIDKTTNNTKQFQRQIKQAENQAKRMRKSISGAFGGVALKIGGTIAALGIAKFAKDSLMLASNLNEVQNVVDTTFGTMTSKINDFAKGAGKQFGMSELQAKQFSGTLGAMMKSSGISGNKLADMSTGLAGLAGDFASFYNLDPAEAFEKIKSAMVGQTEPMLGLGINMNVASMEAYALQKGIKKSWKEMSEAEKQTLRYNYLLEKSKDAQGDYTKTNTGFANSLRTLTIKIKDMGAKVMAYAIPPLEKLFAKWLAFMDGVNIDEIMKKVINLGKTGFEYLSNSISWVKDNMNWLMPVASGLLGTFIAFQVVTKVAAAFEALNKITQTTTIMQWLLNASMLANPMMQVALGIGALIAIGVLLWKNWDTIKVKALSLWEGIKTAFAPMGDFFAGLWAGVKNGFRGLINFVIKGANMWIKGLLTPFNLLIKAANLIPGIKIPEIGFKIPELPSFATGTQYFKGGAARINERGGEIVDLPNGSRVIPADKSKKILSKSGGNIFNFYFNGNVGTEEFFNQAGEFIAKRVVTVLEANM